MARFDIYDNPGRNQKNVPFLLDVQSNVISGLATRIVIPLRPLSLFSSIKMPSDVFPIIVVSGVSYFLDTPQLGAIPLSELKSKAGSARNQQTDIQQALDRVFGAY